MILEDPLVIPWGSEINYLNPFTVPNQIVKAQKMTITKIRHLRNRFSGKLWAINMMLTVLIVAYKQHTICHDSAESTAEVFSRSIILILYRKAIYTIVQKMKSDLLLKQRMKLIKLNIEPIIYTETTMRSSKLLGYKMLIIYIHILEIVTVRPIMQASYFLFSQQLSISFSIIDLPSSVEST